MTFGKTKQCLWTFPTVLHTARILPIPGSPPLTSVSHSCLYFCAASLQQLEQGNNGGELMREPKNLCPPLVHLSEVDLFCHCCKRSISMRSLSCSIPLLVYWALNLACYLWQIYDYIHYSSNSFREKLRGAQRKWIIQNNYAIKEAVSEHCDSAPKWNER